MMNFLPRIRQTIILIFLAAVLQYAFVYFIWTFFCSTNSPSINALHNEFKRGLITCIIREFDGEANDLPGTVDSLSSLNEIAKVLVVSDGQIYPPLVSKQPKLSFFQIRPDLRTARTQKPLRGHLQDNEWILIAPDGTRTSVLRIGEYLELAAEGRDDVKIWAFRVRGRRASCQSVNLDWKRWTLQSNSTSSVDGVCDAATGALVYLMRTKEFLDLPEPLMQPLDESLLIQASIFGWKTQILERTPFFRSDRLLDPQVISQQRSNRDGHIRSLYDRFQIKQSIKNGNAETYGCSKTTPRCFGNVVNETPSYLYEGRWTPPCCVNALKATLQHVIEVFDFNNVAYWLEGGSLLGAARNGQLIPWDYDIDIGMFLNDTSSIQYLQAAADGPVLDPQGFAWEKSQPSEGQFYRVHYSRTNRLHVDIFPFYANGSVMTKDFWFASHPQDREFPATFLTPLESTTFLGLTVSVPNRMRDFLELKFGPGCIEHPKYPHNLTL